MRIVLAEDEKMTRNGILHIIEHYTEHEVIGVAENGKQGYMLVKEKQPDLLISDIKMPVMDGMEMLQKLYDEKCMVPTILLTGYSDFEYARKAIKFQVMDYLLKPLDTEEFLKNLNDAETKISNIRISQVSAKHLLVNYLEGQYEDNGTQYDLLCELLHMNERTEMSLFLISPGKIFEEHIKEYMKCASSVMEALCIDNVQVFQLPGEKQAVVLVAGTEKNRTLKNRFEMKVIPELEEIGKCTCAFTRICGLQNLKNAIEDMKQMIEAAFSVPNHKLIDSETVETLQYQDIRYPQNTEASMIRELRNGHGEKAVDYGKKFADQVVNESVKPEMIKEYTIRLMAKVFRVFTEVNGLSDEEQNMKYFMESVISSETMEEVRYQLEKFLHALYRENEKEISVENGIVMNAISYIRDHYREEISLSEAARICRVTPEYLSKIFYNETGINFSHFIQNFRISVAKRMLFAENCKVYEVAEAVGFRDQKYFVKIFKKLCGVTPTEYRKEFRE